MQITTDNAIPFTGATTCFAMGGFENLDGKTVGCRLNGINVIIIEYFSKILVDHNGLYSIRFDVPTTVAAMGTTLSTTAAIINIYAGA